ncbi:MAG TPA: universal stress protein [Bacteroidales bacterium]|nr:universal stress protein [Bacteroidales bacterium]
MKNILVPTNLSHNSDNVLKCAIHLGINGGYKLFFYIANINNPVLTKEYALKHIANIFKALNLDPAHVQTELIVEDTFFSNTQIKSIIDKFSINLVLLETHPKVYKNTFFDTQVLDLIDNAQCPVLLIAPDCKDVSIERIGYATELYDLSARLNEIMPWVKKLGASVEAFHVYPVYPQNVDLKEYNVKEALSLVREDNAYEKINLYFIKTDRNNEIVEGISEFLNIYKPDMLVMYHSPMGILDKLLMDSGTTLSVLKVSRIPVLILNHKTKEVLP